MCMPVCVVCAAKVPAENRISMALGPKVLPASFNPSDVLKKNRKRAPPKGKSVYVYCSCCCPVIVECQTGLCMLSSDTYIKP